MNLEYEIDSVVRDLTRIAQDNKGKPMSREDLQGLYDAMATARGVLESYYDRAEDVLTDNQDVRVAK